MGGDRHARVPDREEGVSCGAIAAAEPRPTRRLEAQQSLARSPHVGRATPAQVVGVSTSHIQFIPWDFIQKPVKDLPKALQCVRGSPPPTQPLVTFPTSRRRQ